MTTPRVEEALAELPDVGGSLSGATFAPTVSGKSRGSLRSFMINRALDQARTKLKDGGYLAEGKNEELWRRLDELLARHRVKYTRVAGHSGHEENDRVDRLAVEAYQKFLRRP